MSLSLIKTLIKEMILNEKRRFHVQNRIKEEIIDVLDQYVNKGYFIHFTNDYSLQGLNVKSGFDTPKGIYVYPFIEKFYSNGTFVVPFAGSRNYVIILKPKGNFVNSSTYSKNDLIEDGQKLGFDKTEIEEAYKNAKYKETPMSALMYLLYKDHGKKKIDFSVQNSARATKRLRDLGYVGMFDNEGIGVIHPKEPIQAFFVGSDMCEIVEIVKNPNVEIRKHEERIFRFKQKQFDKMSNEEILQLIFNNDLNINSISNHRCIKFFKEISSNFELLQKIYYFIQNNKTNNFKLIFFNNIKSFNKEFQFWIVEKEINNENYIIVSNDVYVELIKKYGFKIMKNIGLNNPKEVFFDKSLQEEILKKLNKTKSAKAAFNFVIKLFGYSFNYFPFSDTEFVNKLINILSKFDDNDDINKLIESIKKYF